jgi:hypothetical protein
MKKIVKHVAKIVIMSGIIYASIIIKGVAR